VSESDGDGGKIGKMSGRNMENCVNQMQFLCEQDCCSPHFVVSKDVLLLWAIKREEDDKHTNCLAETSPLWGIARLLDFCCMDCLPTMTIAARP